MTAVFQRSILPGQMYPCTPDDLRGAIRAFPAGDLKGLHAVGLAPQTRKDHSAFARYLFWPPRAIHIYSLPASLSYRQPPHMKLRYLEESLATEFGMRFEKSGSRWTCYWTPEDIRRYTLEYVLAHEVGHHVAYLLRRDALLTPVSSEQFAHHYALQRLRAR